MATSTTKKERDYWRGATNWLIENDHEDKYFCPDELTSEFFLRLLDDADRCAELEASLNAEKRPQKKTDKKPVQTRCRNCRELPSIEFIGNDAAYPYILTHTSNTCPAEFCFMSHQKTAETCIKDWNEFNSKPKK